MLRASWSKTGQLVRVASALVLLLCACGARAFVVPNQGGGPSSSSSGVRRVARATGDRPPDLLALHEALVASRDPQAATAFTNELRAAKAELRRTLRPNAADEAIRRVVRGNPLRVAGTTSKLRLLAGTWRCLGPALCDGIAAGATLKLDVKAQTFALVGADKDSSSSDDDDDAGKTQRAVSGTFEAAGDAALALVGGDEPLRLDLPYLDQDLLVCSLDGGATFAAFERTSPLEPASKKVAEE